MIEKTLAFGYPFFLRVIVPGVAASFVWYLILWPLIGNTVNLSDKVALALFFSVFTVALGVFVSLADGAIYSVYEGRSMWPDRLRRWSTHRIQTRLERRAKEASEISDMQEKDEIWSWLRRFPVTEDGKPKAERPTELGAILYAYEDYPFQKYGMDSVFYWPRIWLKIDDKTRKEIDALWAPADCLTYLSFVSGLGAVLFVSLLLGSWVQIFWNATQLADLHILWGAAGVSLLILWRIFYHLSLPLHVKNGEIFKSIFDVYRKELENIAITYEEVASEKRKWSGTWRYLQYHMRADSEERPGSPLHTSNPKQ